MNPKPYSTTYTDFLGNLQFAAFETFAELTAFLAGRESAGAAAIPQAEMPCCPDCGLPTYCPPDGDCEQPKNHTFPQPKDKQ